MGCGTSKDTKEPKKSQQNKQQDEQKEISSSQSNKDVVADEQKKTQQNNNAQAQQQQNQTENITKAEAPQNIKLSSEVVIRKSINQLSEQEFDRFFKAIRKMMENKSGPGTSDFFEIAGYHGWPSDFCHHGTETFPVWHRAYLVHFEQALKKADKALGNDGNIGLPYWDWTKELYPEKIRERHSDFPKDFFPSQNSQEADQFKNVLFQQRRPMSELQQYIDSSSAALQAKDALLTTEHWKYASTRWRGGVSVEASHNSIHMACGFPMTSIQFAAFDILFWLHHCNVDRYFQKYLQLETDSYEEFSNTQRILHEQRGERNRALEPLHPFVNPVTKKPFMPKDGYDDTKSILYSYDQLPETPKQEMRAFPVLAIFEDINTLKLKKKSYLLHVFVTKQGQQDFKFPSEVKSFKDSANYAGWGAIFGGKGKECENCKFKQPFHVLIDISSALQKQSVKANQAQLHVICQDEYGNLVKFEETQGLPFPKINGPFFSDHDSEIKKEGTENQLETLRIQKYLSLLGYYEGEQDGQFGEHTHNAVLEYQKFYGLTADGIIGSETKKSILNARFDISKDNVKQTKPNFQKGQDLVYFVGTQPGYMDRKKLLLEVQQGFETWNKVTNIFKKITLTETQAQANLSILFGDRTGDNLFVFDKVGGNLAFSTEKEINFDQSDRWALLGEDLKANYFRFLPVLIHEIGHVLGLPHSQGVLDIMSPFYHAEKLELKDNDIQSIKQLYTIQ